MDTLLQDLRFALRSLKRSPGFTAVAVLTLALGIGANVAIFSVVQTLLWRSIPGVADSEELVQVYTSDYSSSLYGSSSYPDYIDFRDQSQSFRGLAAFSPATEVNLASEDGEPLRAAVSFVSGNYFGVLGTDPAIGRVLTPGDDAPGAPAVAVLAHAIWERRFGSDPGVVGATLRLNGDPVTVVGIAPPEFRGTDLADQPDLWVPMSGVDLIGFAPFLEFRGVRWLKLIGRLATGVSIDRAAAEIRAIAARLAETYPDTNLGTLEAPDAPRPMTLVPADGSMSGPGERATLERISFLLLGIVGLVLLIACANLANLLLARASGRAREIAVRVSLGAGRGRLVRQLVTESLVLALLGGAAGVLVAAWLADVILASGLAADFASRGSVPNARIDLGVLGFALAISLAAGIVFGLAPAMRASRADQVTALKGSASGADRTAGGLGLRDMLVVGQVGLALLLLVVTGLFVQSLRRTLAVDPGFSLERALVAAVDLGSGDYEPSEGIAFFEGLEERIESVPGVRAATLARWMPLSTKGGRWGITIEGYEPRPDEDMEFEFNIVGADYFETMGIPLLAGRGFRRSDRAGAPKVVVVNEEFARRLTGGEAVGTRIRFGGPDDPATEIVGVVATGRYRSLREVPIPYMYLPFAQNFEGNFGSVMELVVATRGDPEGLVPAVREELRALDPDLPLFDVRTLEEHVGGLVATERAIAALVAAFGILALFLAALGLYGLLSFLVARRTREIGVRVALGAPAAQVQRLFLRRGLMITAAGLVIGLAAAALLTRLVAGLLFGVSATDPLVFVMTALVLLAAGALAAYAPARRAARVDPIVALRAE